MIKSEQLAPGIIQNEITGSVADISIEFFYLVAAWAEKMEELTGTDKYVHIWNACMVALGDDMDIEDVAAVADFTRNNQYYLPRRSDGIPEYLMTALEGGID